MLAIVARMKVNEGKEQEFEQLMGALAAQVQEHEPGCSLYQLFKSQDGSSYVVLERYDSQEAMGAHMKSAHFREAMPKLGELLDGRAEIEVLNQV